MKMLVLLFISLALSSFSTAQELSKLAVSENGRYLVKEDEKPFFWLGDTAWELLHRLTKEEIDIYLEDRAKKGFTVIQTVVLAELDGLTVPNAYGHKPLIDNDPTKLNDEYFRIVDYTTEKALDLGLYVGLLPTWGDKFNKKWGTDSEIFTPENAKIYGETLAKRYANSENIIWILGGDRIPEKEVHFEIIRAMANGIKESDQEHLMTYHPSGSRIASDFFDERWLEIDMYQSGHSRKAQEYKFVLEKLKQKGSRPIINGEARYENIPNRFWEKKNLGWLDAADVRISAYWTMIAGAAGYTYGCNDIWQMYDYRREPTISARTDWPNALDLPGASQMTILKEIFEKLPWQEMKYDSTIIVNENPKDTAFSMASINKEQNIIIAYTPTGRLLDINMSQLKVDKVNAVWFNPRSSSMVKIGQFDTIINQRFTPWSSGWGSDFLLILYADDSGFEPF